MISAYWAEQAGDPALQEFSTFSYDIVISGRQCRYWLEVCIALSDTTKQWRLSQILTSCDSFSQTCDL
jgi:hypothetical protein